MQTTQDLLKQAIAAARAGREWTARDIFLQIVEADPRNELAWMWLTGLLDELDDRVYACEQVLQINPKNIRAAQYLSQLRAEKQKQLDRENLRVEEKLRAAREALKEGRKDSALADLRVLALNPQSANPDMWRMLADVSPEWQERAQALERLAELNPQDERAQEELQRARYYLQHPIHQAELYEEHGELDKALMLYRSIAANTDAKSKEWERIFWKINELESLKRERITHIPPALDIARLTAGPPIVYFMFALAHVGINPFAYPDPLTWTGLLWVTLGAFLVALASTRSHNRLWTLLFKDVGAKGSPAARRAMSLAGWALVALPHVLMFAAAAYRLSDFRFLTP